MAKVSSKVTATSSFRPSMAEEPEGDQQGQQPGPMRRITDLFGWTAASPEHTTEHETEDDEDLDNNQQPRESAKKKRRSLASTRNSVVSEASQEVAEQIQDEFDAIADIRKQKKEVRFSKYVTRIPNESEDTASQAYRTQEKALGVLTVDTLAEVTQEDPQFIFDCLGEFMACSRIINAERDAYKKANEVNKERVATLSDELDDAVARAQNAEDRVSILNNSSEQPGELAREKAKVKDLRDLATKLKEAKSNLQSDYDLLQDDVNSLRQHVDSLEKDGGRGRSQRCETRPRSPATSHERFMQSIQNTEHIVPSRNTAALSPDVGLDCRRDGATAFSHVTNRTIVYDSSLPQPVVTNKDVEKPPKFDGDKKKWQEWVTKLEMKLRVTRFQTPLDGLWFVRGFLEDRAFRLVNSRIPSEYGSRNCYNAFANIEEMLEYLKKHYAEINTFTQASNRLRNLRQGPNESFSDFYVKFQEQASYLDYSERHEIETLMHALNARYLKVMTDGTTYPGINDVVDRCTRLESSFEMLDSAHPRSERGSGSGRGGRGGGNSGHGGGGSRGDNNRKRQLPSPYDKMEPMTDAIKKRIQDRKDCRKCRKPGHMSWMRDQCDLGKFSEKEIDEILKANNKSGVGANHTATVEDAPDDNEGQGNAGTMV